MAFLDIIDLYLRRLKRYDTYSSRRRLFLLIVIICLIFIYIIPLIFRKFWSNSVEYSDTNAECVEQYIRPFLSEEQTFDTNIYKSYELLPNDKKKFLPYVGNGKFAINVDNSENAINILGKRSLNIAIPFYPIIKVNFFGSNSQYANVLRFKEGIVKRITCFDYLKKSASIEQTFYAHRLISTLFVQEIKITNPTNVPLVLKLSRKGWTGKSNPKLQKIMIQHKNDYSLIVGNFELSDSNSNSRIIAVAIAFSEIPDVIEVNSHSQKTFIVQTFMNHTIPVSSTQIAAKVPELVIAIRETAKKVIELSSSTLERYHSEMWQNLWSSGFGISHSKAPNTLNGDVINATIYYLLSQRNSFPNDNDVINLNDFELSKSVMLIPDRCYTGHSTLQASTLWSKLETMSEVNRITSLWLLTLEKQGCHHLINSGSQGVMQAIILSLASLQFTSHHLEFNTHPNELHRNYYIRRVVYGNGTLINITVALTDDNKAQIFVSLDKNPMDKDFYACDAGCLDAPVSLSYIPKDFPVKQTEPMTSILYITSDKQHIEELKHTIHVKEINEAPAHEHQTIVLHKYGHTLAGLPAMFWVSIVFLIVIFHLFLGKLIYNEYCGGSAVSNVPYDRHRTGRYAM